jgi:hypothetical protein
MDKPDKGILGNFGNTLGYLLANTIEKSTSLVKTPSLFFNSEEAIKAALDDKKAFSNKLKVMEEIRNEKSTNKQSVKKRVEWSFDNVPNTDEVNENKLMMSAISSAKIMEDIKANKTKITSTPPVIADTNPTILDLQKQIKCIECSIKKLELNLKLTNEDGINDGELLTLLQEISKLCSKEEGADCDDDLQSFVDEVILKRDMNSISGLIKLASFMCPILAFANKSLVSELGDKDIIDSQSLKGAANICSKIIGYVAETGNDNTALIENVSETVDFIGASHEAGVIEGVVSFIGIGATKSVEIKKKIKGSIISVVRATIKNTIDKVFKTATKYQQFICMVFITLLSTHILLTMSIKGTEGADAAEAASAYYSSVIEHAYNTTMTIGNGTMSIENETITTGGKKASKSRRAANAIATKPKPKPVAKATAKATANATNATKPKPKAAKAAAPKKKK